MLIIGEFDRKTWSIFGRTSYMNDKARSILPKRIWLLLNQRDDQIGVLTGAEDQHRCTFPDWVKIKEMVRA